jgi:hypothetical protein
LTEQTKQNPVSRRAQPALLSRCLREHAGHAEVDNFHKHRNCYPVTVMSVYKLIREPCMSPGNCIGAIQR